MKEKIENWWKQTLYDLKIAEYNLESDILDAYPFFSQQTVKKALKFLYIEEKKVLKRTHNVSGLAKEPQFSNSLVKRISELGLFYHRKHYSNIIKKVPIEDFEKSDIQEFVKFEKKKRQISIIRTTSKEGIEI